MDIHIRIPFIVDIIWVRSANTILELGNDAYLDRRFERAGPILNRIIAGRVRSVLRVGNQPLPSATRRCDKARKAQQQALASQLDPTTVPPPWDDAAIDAVAAFVGDQANRSAGELTQELIGRLFVKNYQASPDTWDAARVLYRGLTSNNVLKRLYWALTFQISKAQRILQIAINRDLAGVHATGIAVHNLVDSVERMTALFSDHERISDDELLANVLVAPESIVRQACSVGATIAGDVRNGTLVIMAVKEAGARTLDQSISFMSESWSFCPAHKLVPALLLEIWNRAKLIEVGGAGS